jgi:hypothetical protein
MEVREFPNPRDLPQLAVDIPPDSAESFPKYIFNTFDFAQRIEHRKRVYHETTEEYLQQLTAGTLATGFRS